MKKNRASLLLALLLSMPVQVVAQSHARPDFKHQHKSAQKYQKSLQKQQKREQAKAAKAIRKQHE